MIFESPEKRKEPIRDIPFHRGLNIVWGVELPDEAGSDATHPVMLSGHSVGKTTLCRLIRYCLGEQKFSNQGAMSRIRNRFPNGWVGLKLVILGRKWTVLKPIGQNGNSKAGEDKPIEELFDVDGKTNQYKDFTEHLESSMLSGLQSNRPRNSEKPYEWKHLLAWLARDQEARFQSLHEWRSPRSQSDTPKFDNPKDDPLYLIRLVLGLIQAKELELYGKKEEAQKQLNQCKTHITALRHEPENRLKDRERQLKQLLKVPLENPLHIDDDIISPLSMKLNEIKGKISEIEGAIEQIDGQIAQKRIWLASYDEQRRVFLYTLKATEEGLEQTSENTSEDEDIQKLREMIRRDCTFGDIPFTQCQYVQQRLANADKVINLQKRREENRVDGQVEKRLAIIEQQRKDHDEIVRVLNSLRQKLKTNLSVRHEKEQELAKRREFIERLNYFVKERQEALDLIEGRVLNTVLQQEIDRADKLQEQMSKWELELDGVQSSYEQNLKSISTIYNSLIKRVLSQSYSGSIRLPKGEVKFGIQEKTGLSGEAVETLALALADVSAMVCSSEGIGVHPRFLVHDSPREADLDRHIYNQYLREMWALTNELGGSDNAPFQYIVTTTSRPPDNLQGAIVLQIKAYPESDMLFKCLLQHPLNPQPDLFSLLDEGMKDKSDG
jgi:hypothetical protein